MICYLLLLNIIFKISINTYIAPKDTVMHNNTIAVFNINDILFIFDYLFVHFLLIDIYNDE